jgi:hypothetical protein
MSHLRLDLLFLLLVNVVLDSISNFLQPAVIIELVFDLALPLSPDGNVMALLLFELPINPPLFFTKTGKLFVSFSLLSCLLLTHFSKLMLHTVNGLHGLFNFSLLILHLRIQVFDFARLLAA